MAVKCFLAPQFLDPILTWYLSAGSVQLVSLAVTRGRAPPLGAFLPSTTKLWQGNIFTPVCHSVHRRGVCLSACWDTHSPLGQTPPSWADTPWQTPPDRHTPWADTRLGRHPPPADGYCSGQYTSCWNAFLSFIFMQFLAKTLPNKNAFQ